MIKECVCNKFKIVFYLQFLVLGLCFFSCQKKSTAKDGNEILFKEFPKGKKVSFTNLFEFKEGIPLKFYLIEDALVIYNVDGKNSSFLFNFSLKDKILTKGYFDGGRGAGEAIGAFSNGTTKDFLWLYDISLKKIITLNKTDIFKENKTGLYKEYPIRDFYYQIALKNDSTFLAVGNPESSYKIQEVDLNSLKVIREYGEYKNVPDNIPFDAYKSSQQCFIVTKPSGNKAVLFYRYTDLIEIFDTQKITSISTKGPEGFDAELDVKREGKENISIRNKKTRFAFINAAVTDEFIYLLYSGKGEDDKYVESSNFIYVYDWEGKPIEKIELDRRINSLTVTEDNKVIYAFDPYTGFIVKTKI